MSCSWAGRRATPPAARSTWATASPRCWPVVRRRSSWSPEERRWSASPARRRPCRRRASPWRTPATSSPPAARSSSTASWQTACWTRWSTTAACCRRTAWPPTRTAPSRWSPTVATWWSPVPSVRAVARSCWRLRATSIWGPRWWPAPWRSAPTAWSRIRAGARSRSPGRLRSRPPATPRSTGAAMISRVPSTWRSAATRCWSTRTASPCATSGQRTCRSRPMAPSRWMASTRSVETWPWIPGAVDRSPRPEPAPPSRCRAGPN